MSKPPTNSEIADERDMMHLQEELEREEAGITRHPTKNGERASKHVEAMRCVVWQKFTKINCREKQIHAQKCLKRQVYLNRRRQATEARKGRNCDSDSDTER